MQKKQVAVLDVGSSKITAVIGERGINNTFVIKASASIPCEGFDENGFYEPEKVKSAIYSAVSEIKNIMRERLDVVYVGVPGAFTDVIVKNSQISFESKKKIQEADVDALFDSAFTLHSGDFTLINRSAIVYELDDFRRLANPIGAVSGILKGKLSFVVCNNYFINFITDAVKSAGVAKVEFISASLAESMYLLDEDVRDRIAVLVDVGYITSTFTLVQGDGVLYQRTFAFGGGHITGALVEEYEISFDLAEKLKRKINLSSISSDLTDEIIDMDKGQYFRISETKKIILSSLDVLCEEIAECMEGSGYSIPEYVPLMITGGGIAYLRGAKEHVAGRLNMAVQVIAPKVPMMDKPIESSKLAILDLALEQ